MASVAPLMVCVRKRRSSRRASLADSLGSTHASGGSARGLASASGPLRQMRPLRVASCENGERGLRARQLLDARSSSRYATTRYVRWMRRAVREGSTFNLEPASLLRMRHGHGTSDVGSSRRPSWQRIRLPEVLTLAEAGPMSATFKCDACGKEEPAFINPMGDVCKPREWFSRHDAKTGRQDVCSHRFIDVLAERTGVSRAVLAV